jgi:hypothetical protein
MADLSSQTIQELRQQLNAAMVAPPSAVAVTPGDFCSAYKTAKPLLQLAVAILSAIPGLAPVAAAITGLMTIADKVCPTS